MKFLLLFLGITFFFIFFAFSRVLSLEEAFFGNLFFVGNIYVFVSISVIFYTYLQEEKYKKNQIQDGKKHNKESFITQINIIEIIKYFFNKGIYYIGVLLFYVAFFLIFKEKLGGIFLPNIFLLFNILVFIFFFFEKKKQVVQDFLRVNTSLISIYYIYNHLMYIFLGVGSFNLVDLANILCIFVLFYLFLYKSSVVKHRNIFYSYIYIFLFLEICVLGKYIFSDNIFIYALLSFAFGVGISLYTDFIKKILQIPKGVSRGMGIIFLSLSVSISIFTMFYQDVKGLVLILTCIISSYLLYVFHYRFLNYIAFFFSSISSLAALYSLYLFITPKHFEEIYSYLFLFLYSGLFLFLGKISSKNIFSDRIFIHLFSFIVNLVGCILFFLFVDFSILGVAILLLAESVYLFFSYYNFKKISGLKS